MSFRIKGKRREDSTEAEPKWRFSFREGERKREREKGREGSKLQCSRSFNFCFQFRSFSGGYCCLVSLDGVPLSTYSLFFGSSPGNLRDWKVKSYCLEQA